MPTQTRWLAGWLPRLRLVGGPLSQLLWPLPRLLQMPLLRSLASLPPLPSRPKLPPLPHLLPLPPLHRQPRVYARFYSARLRTS